MPESKPATEPVPPSPQILRLAAPLEDHLGVPDATILVALPDEACVELDVDSGEAADLADVLASRGARCAVRIHHVESRWAVPEPVHLASRVLERVLAVGSWGSAGAGAGAAGASESASEEIAAGALGPERPLASVAEAAVRLPTHLDGEALAFASSMGTPGMEAAALRDGLEEVLVLVRSFQRAYEQTTSRQVRRATMASLPPVVPAAVTASGGLGEVGRAVVPTEVGPASHGPPLGADELALLRDMLAASPAWQIFAVAEELRRALDGALASEDLLAAAVLAPAIGEAALRDAALVLLWRAGVTPTSARAQVDVETPRELIDGPIAATHDWSDIHIEQLRQWSDQLMTCRDRALRWGRWPSRSEATRGRWITTQLIDQLERAVSTDHFTAGTPFEEWRAAVAS